MNNPLVRLRKKWKEWNKIRNERVHRVDITTINTGIWKLLKDYE